MATMVKEKRREKKKTKEKSLPKTSVAQQIPSLTEEDGPSLATTVHSVSVKESILTEPSADTECHYQDVLTDSNITTTERHESLASFAVASSVSQEIEDSSQISETTQTSDRAPKESSQTHQIAQSTMEKVTYPYKHLSTQLENLSIPDYIEPITDLRELELENPEAYLKPTTIVRESHYEQAVETVMPSAPMFEEQVIQPSGPIQELIQEARFKPQCMSLEEAMRLYGGTEMAKVKAMSEREEAIVEAGPVSGPEHPLVDLLSTFRSSLLAMEREKSKLACGFADEEKSRSQLWRIQKRNIYQKKECKCGTSVELKAMYEHAILLKERLPVAKMRLESLLRDVQDSYCHHQHAVLLAHCQIEELISETVQSNKSEIREALSLVLQALRVSDSGTMLPAALQRWAAALAAALLDERDVSQLLFVLHHLFRQSLSVRWAAQPLRTRVPDGAAAARSLALLDTLLAGCRLDTAQECTEDVEAEDSWEEVGARGGGGAVSDGALRERDLLALLRALALRELVARLLLFTHSDIRIAREYEWGDTSGGLGVIRACCGVRTLLAVFTRATRAHAQYARLHRRLRRAAAAALVALDCLHRSPRTPYKKDREPQISAELEACFADAFSLFGSRDLHKLTTTLLAEDTAKDYCFAFIVGLHEKTAKRIELLNVEAPVVSCAVRVRIATQAAVHRERDHELARIVLDFLYQTGIKKTSVTCPGGCEAAARACLPRLLARHRYLHTVALHIMADMAQVESLDPSIVSVLHVDTWRPSAEEAGAVLHDWAQRCPLLLQQLLLQLDCTPFSGISLPVQLCIGSWLCDHVRTLPPSATEPFWKALMRLRTHATCWRGASLDTSAMSAPVPEPVDSFSNAWALLSSAWGHSIPLICSSGVSALCSLTPRPRAAMHCLAPVMLAMAPSPESLSLTPKFTELFTTLLNCGPGVVQRAFGRGGVSGSELLLRLALSQVEGEPSGIPHVFSTWLHALWRAPHAHAPPLLDALAVAARDWPALDAHAALLLKDENAKEHINNAVRNASTAPLLCECLLRAAHAHWEVNTRLFASVSSVLWQQRINAQKIHVDNALQKIGAKISSEDLVIYRCAYAALTAPPHHPAHLTLWRLFFHLYLQRPPDNQHDAALPVGPLFFSGLVKSRTLSQIKKRLQETAAYHRTEAEALKGSGDSAGTSRRPSGIAVESEPVTTDDDLFPVLTIKDLTGELSDSSDSDDSDSDSESEDSDEDSKTEANPGQDASEKEKRQTFNMACYHTAAERLTRQYLKWVDEGEAVRAAPHHADIARFIPEQALEAAWQCVLARVRPPPCAALDDFPHPAGPPPPPPDAPDSPLSIAVKSIKNIKDRTKIRFRRLIQSPLGDIDFKDSRALLAIVDQHLKDIEKLAQEWCSEVSRITTLDSKLWELVASLRVPRPLPPVTKHCTNKCKPITFYIDEREWCISTGAERGIRENRCSARSSVRRLARARPRAARGAAALHSIARRIRDAASAISVLERAWRCAAVTPPCNAAQDALTALVTEIAERWVCHDGRLCSELLARWCSRPPAPLQQALCGALVCPRKLRTNEWPEVYVALLKAKLPPHTAFSYLSKFEMGQWSRVADAGQRREVLDALRGAALRPGPAPAPAPAAQRAILLELIAVHAAALITASELCAEVLQCVAAAVDGAITEEYWTSILRAAENTAGDVPFDQLGHLLRDLGARWWAARARGAPALAAHAPHVAALQRTLTRAFVANAVKLSYQPERVGWYAWSALQESWGAWLCPRPAPPPLLPPPPAPDYAAMLRHFVGVVQQIMLDCPGCEVQLLQQVFEWATQPYLSVTAPAGQGGRALAAEMLAQLARLPWPEHQWFGGGCVQRAAQLCACADPELAAWLCAALRGASAAAMLRDVADDALAPRLAALLHLFTGARLPHSGTILEEATLLPWWRLPEPALGEALDLFFTAHHDPALPYHEAPHFRIILFASELRVHPTSVRPSAHSRQKRGRAVSQWVRAATAPSLVTHVAPHSRHMLDTLTELAPYLEDDEIEELLGRASVIMCVEPAAAEALPVWQKCVSSGSARMALACACAASALTAPQYSAALADSAARAYLALSEADWSPLVALWRARSCWRDAHSFAARACLHAAYVCALAHTHAARAQPLLAALAAANINFVENEVIVAVWICYACRVARECATSAASATSATSEAEESRQCARALVASWGQAARRSILRVVTLQTDTDKPTSQHRLLCRLADCILSPSAESVQAYETACAALGAGLGDVVAWGRGAHPRRLPRLAGRLYPKYERYFSWEMQASPETS